jgi:hypothetical protein
LFLCVGDSGVVGKRQSIAGVIVFGLGKRPPNVIGALNDNAHRPFDPRLLPSVRFAHTEIIDNRIGVLWDKRNEELTAQK